MKKTLTAITLALVLTFGASFVNAGIIVTDSPVSNDNDCKVEEDGGVVKDIKEIIEEILGIIVTDSPVADDGQCKEKSEANGIIVTD